MLGPAVWKKKELVLGIHTQAPVGYSSSNIWPTTIRPARGVFFIFPNHGLHVASNVHATSIDSQLLFSKHHRNAHHVIVFFFFGIDYPRAAARK